MKMIVSIFTRIVLMLSLADFFISYAVLASESVSIKSTSKKAKE